MLLHGWGDSADTWRPLLAELGARDRRAIAVDLPGFGTASPLDDGSMLPQLDAFADALVREWAGDEDVVVVGNSLGGVTALRLAERRRPAARRRRPGRARRAADAALVRRHRARPAACGGCSRCRCRSRRPVLRAMVGEIYRQLVFARPRAAEAAVVAAFAAHHASRERVAALLASGRRLLPELQTSPFDVRARRVPGAAGVGHARPHGPAHRARGSCSRRSRDTHVELLEGVGHCPQLEATERLLELLLPFPAAVRA